MVVRIWCPPFKTDASNGKSVEGIVRLAWFPTKEPGLLFWPLWPVVFPWTSPKSRATAPENSPKRGKLGRVVRTAMRRIKGKVQACAVQERRPLLFLGT